MYQFFDQREFQESEKHIPEFLRAYHGRMSLAYHSTFSSYNKTPNYQLKDLAKAYGLKEIWIKDEGERFGLPAFKVLGASYAVALALAKELELDLNKLSFSLVKEKVKDSKRQFLFVTATDGNHGHAVAWVAKELSCEAIIYMPKGTKEIRLKRVRDLGAKAETIEGNYDEAVRKAAETAIENGAILIQDTAWDGYEEIPQFIMQGYMTMAYESFRQMGERIPTHIFLQAGVGSMAGAMMSFYADVAPNKRPVFVIVEPLSSACCLKSVKAQDGERHRVKGALETVMAGLACGEVNALAWPILRGYGDFFFAIPDAWALEAVARLNYPLRNDKKIIAGESGAAGFALLWQLMKNKKFAHLKGTLGLNEDSAVLCFNTEGETDPATGKYALEVYKELFI